MRTKLFVSIAGTWNVNGGKNMHNVAFRNEAKLSDWIFPHANLGLFLVLARKDNEITAFHNIS